MSDRTNLAMHILTTSAEVRAGARAAFEEYSGGFDHYEDEETETSLVIGANECRVGSTLELVEALDAVAEETDTDFAYYVNEDPAYEWLGTVAIHVPGLTPDYEGNCDADGGVVLSAYQVGQLLEIDDDTELRVQLRLKAGKPWTEAFAHHAGTTVAPVVSPANGEDDER